MRLMKRTAPGILILTLMLGIVLSLCAATHASKIGVNYLSGGDSATTKRLIESGDLPVLRTGIGEVDGLIPYYKQHCPDGIAIVANVGDSLDYNANPVSEANRRWNEYLGPRLIPLTEAEKAMIDYVEVSPNMSEPHTVERAQWWNSYSATLCPLVGNLGLKPMIYTIGVGGMPCCGSEELAVLQAMIPSLRYAHYYGGGWAYHGYTIQYTMDYVIESYYSLRYRRAYDYFEDHAPDLLTMPLVIAEGGVDYLGNPETDGYAYRGTRQDYAEWLHWYDQEVMQDPYVVGVTLFKIGGGAQSWPSFDVDPMVPWLMSYWETGQADWPRPPTALGMCVLGEQSMSDEVQAVCNSAAPVIYTTPDEVKSGGAIDVFKAANPDGIVIVNMQSKMPDRSQQPNGTDAANDRWDAMLEVLGRMTTAQREKIDFVDATPGPVDLPTTADVDYFGDYMDRLRQKLSDQGFRTIIATFDPSTLPVDAADWAVFSPFDSAWKNAGKDGGAVLYQSGVTSYAKSADTASGLLKYRQCYAYLLKYRTWLLSAPVFVMLGDGEDMRTVPDAVGGKRRAKLGQMADWLGWFDSEANKDPDVLGILPFKVGAPYAYPESDLGGLVDWYTNYVSNAD